MTTVRIRITSSNAVTARDTPKINKAMPTITTASGPVVGRRQHDQAGADDGGAGGDGHGADGRGRLELESLVGGGGSRHSSTLSSLTVRRSEAIGRAAVSARRAAARVGFEPTERSPARALSRRLH